MKETGEMINRNVLVTTEYRGVFCGTLTEWDRANRTAVLTNVRHCTYWPTECRGFVGLATIGPVRGAKVSKMAPSIELAGVTSLTPVTDAAAKEWEAERWS
jgi:hypothetical protein